MKSANTILGTFDEQSAKEFKDLYELARSKNHEIFQWRGEHVLVGLAKYMVEHLINLKLLTDESPKRTTQVS